MIKSQQCRQEEEHYLKPKNIIEKTWKKHGQQSSEGDFGIQEGHNEYLQAKVREFKRQFENDIKVKS